MIFYTYNKYKNKNSILMFKEGSTNMADDNITIKLVFASGENLNYNFSKNIIYIRNN